LAPRLAGSGRGAGGSPGQSGSGFDQLFANDISAFFVVDLIITAIVFLVFMAREAGRYRMRNWWLYIVGTLVVGPSFAFPLFLYFREPRMGELKSS
jgi:sugar phosphate permease